MKKVKVSMFLILSVLCVFGFTEKNEAAFDEYLYFSNKDLRNELINPLFYSLENNGLQQQADEAQLLFNNFGLFKAEDVKAVKHLGIEASNKYKSVEGIENLENLEELLLEGGQLLDLSPLEKLTKLKYLGIDTSATTTNINYVKNMENLEDFYIRDHSSYGEDTTQMSITDISALSDLSNLTSATIESRYGSFPTIVLREGYRKYEVLDPIILSSQFDGASISYSSDDSNFINSDGLLKWNAIPFGTEELHLQWQIQKDQFYYSGIARIPIVWK